MIPCARFSHFLIFMDVDVLFLGDVEFFFFSIFFRLLGVSHT